MTRERINELFWNDYVIIICELRGWRAEAAGFIDQRTGEKVVCVRVVYVIECACRGSIDRVILSQTRLGVENPEDVCLPYEKGKRYAFFPESFRIERGQVSGWIGERGLEPIETDEEAGCAPQGALPPLILLISKQLHSPSMTKSKAAFLFAARTLGKQQLYLWTFTFREVVAVKETRKKWNHLLTLLMRRLARVARIARVRIA